MPARFSIRARSLAGKALRSQRRDRGFESHRVHQRRTAILIQRVSGLRFFLFARKHDFKGVWAFIPPAAARQRDSLPPTQFAKALGSSRLSFILWVSFHL